MTLGHPLENELSASAWDILSAVRAGSRAVTDAKGKLAEYFLAQRLEELKKSNKIDAFEWLDKDGQPDFVIVHRGRRLLLECKNVRSKSACDQIVSGCKIELQKTRNSKDGLPTRGYRFTEFHVLAACLFNVTHKWEYVFISARDLACRDNIPELMQIKQFVPLRPNGPWKAELLDVLPPT